MPEAPKEHSLGRTVSIGDARSSGDSALGQSTVDGLVELGRVIYERSLVRRDDEYITDPRGHPIGWLLDTRMAMLESTPFKEIGDVLAARLRAKGVRQIAGFGFGAYALVGSVLSAPGGNFKAGFIRDRRKPHGRRRLVEGPLDRDEPVVLLDDIINSGRSALRGVELLREDGFPVVGVLTLFNFTWSGGRSRLEAMELWVDSLLDLNLKEGRLDSRKSRL